MTGAAQRRVPCPHVEGRGADLAMASRVSNNNHQFFVSEGRVPGEVTVSDIRDYLDHAEEDDSVLVVCNACDRVMLVDNGLETVLAGGSSPAMEVGER